MSSPFALAIYTEGVEDSEIALPAGSTRYFTPADPIGNLRDGTFSGEPVGNFAIKGDKLWLNVKRSKDLTVRVNGVGFTGTTQLDYNDEIEIGPVKLLVVMADLPPLVFDDNLSTSASGSGSGSGITSVRASVEQGLKDSGIHLLPDNLSAAAAPAPDADGDDKGPAFLGDLPHASEATRAAQMFMEFEAREAENEALGAVLQEMGFLTEAQCNAVREKIRDYFLENFKLPADFGQLLVNNRLITQEQLGRALDRMRQRLKAKSGGSELEEWIPDVEPDVEKEIGRFKVLNEQFIELARERADIDGNAERALKLGAEDGRVYLAQIALDFGMASRQRLLELRQRQQINAAQAGAQRMWKVLHSSGLAPEAVREAVVEQVRRIKAGGSSDIFEILVERGLLSTGDVAQVREEVAKLPAKEGELTIAPFDIPELVEPSPATRAGNELGVNVLHRKQITPVQYSTLRHLQDGLRLSGHVRSLFDLIRAKGLLAADDIEYMQVELASLRARWEDAQLADSLVTLQIIAPEERDGLLRATLDRREKAIETRDTSALRIRLGLVLHDLNKVPRGPAAAALLKNGVIEHYTNLLGEDMRYPSDRETMAWAAKKFKLSNRRQIELSCAHQEFCMMLAVPLISFLVDEGVVPEDEADAYTRNAWFKNLRTKEEKLFAQAVASGLIEKPLASKCLQLQALAFSKKKTVTSAWVPWFKSRIENPTRPILPGQSEAAAALNIIGDAGPDSFHETFEDAASGRLTAPEPAKVIGDDGADLALAAANDVPEIKLVQGIGGGRGGNTVAKFRQADDHYEISPLMGGNRTPGLDDRKPGVTVMLTRAADTGAAATVSPPGGAALDGSAMPGTDPNDFSIPPANITRKQLGIELLELKKQATELGGEEKDRARIHEINRRLCVEGLPPSDQFALVLMRQQLLDKLDQPNDCDWSADDIEARFKQIRRESDAHWRAIVDGWMPAIYGPQESVVVGDLVYLGGAFNNLVEPNMAISHALIYPPLAWFIPHADGLGFGTAPRIPLLAIDPRACRVDMQRGTLTLSFQLEEKTGGYLPQEKGKRADVVFGVSKAIGKGAPAARHLSQFMAKLLDLRKRYVDQVYRAQTHRTLPKQTISYFLGLLKQARNKSPQERAKRVKLHLLELLKDVVFGIHPVEAHALGLGEFLKIATKHDLVANLAKMVVDANKMEPEQAGTELDQAVRMILAEVSPQEMHFAVYNPKAEIEAAEKPAPLPPWTGIVARPENPFAAVMRYWHGNPVSAKAYIK